MNNMANKRIMLTTTSLTGGGAERVLTVWANELSELGYAVSILVAGRVENEYQVSDRVKVYSVCDNYRDYQNLNFKQKIKLRRNILIKEAPEFLISFLPHIQVLSMLSSLGLKIKRIDTVRISPWNAFKKDDLRHTFLWKLSMYTCHRLILQTAEQAEYFGKSIQKKCVVIPNPISERSIEYYKTGFEDVPRKMIAAGRISSQKNYKMMIDAFTITACQNPKLDFTLDIYGSEDGLSVKELEDYVQSKKMSDRIHFMGRSNELYKKLCASDIFLMSSDCEGMPNALIEAMASQLVCISTDCRTGPKDLIDDGINGYLVHTGNAESMADSMKKALELSKNDRIAMGQKARSKVLTLCSKENSRDVLTEILRG